jgi:hypothetical protein
MPPATAADLGLPFLSGGRDFKVAGGNVETTTADLGVAGANAKPATAADLGGDAAPRTRFRAAARAQAPFEPSSSMPLWDRERGV